ncbi:MAG: type II CAAX prenyl endopeptidase Rce1 family protein [Akkermansia sp.]
MIGIGGETAAAILFGVLGILCWLAPTMAADRLPGGPDAWFGHPEWPWYRYLLGIDARPEGFDPSAGFAPGSWSWLTALALRFFRAVIVVAVVEELFWRGYLMRFLVNPDHPWKVPFGTHSWKAYWITTLCFMAVHQPVDYCGAFIYGSLAYLLAVWQKNLCAVIVMHAVANALLGWAALEWGKCGLW